MGYSTSCSLLCVAIVLALCWNINGLDITNVVGQYPDLAQFNKYLTETKLAEEINKLNAVTILALDDGAMASLSGKPVEVIKAILSTHVLTGFWDDKRLVMDAVGSHAKLETLLQSSGAAKGDQGYIYASLIGEGELAFGSAAGSNDESQFGFLVRTVTAQPQTLSILLIHKPIFTPGISDSTASSASIAHSPSAFAPAPAPSAASHLCIGLLAAASAASSILFLA
ncbi:hypothetical protein VNO78_01006 [Psophocarpus tetragonolobus]|uniref:FAS1 domain-containing protein n=1 Tax=Psophocarpus tetragonolobus TaxID=3891 RepID=A0AAN9XUF9_PSOTE